MHSGTWLKIDLLIQVALYVTYSLISYDQT